MGSVVDWMKKQRAESTFTTVLQIAYATVQLCNPLFPIPSLLPSLFPILMLIWAHGGGYGKLSRKVFFPFFNLAFCRSDEQSVCISH